MANSSSGPRTVILITRDGMGRAEPSLSHKLIKTYLGLLDLEDRLPSVICFYAEGVRLALADSPVLEELQALAGKGVRLLICGTCVNHYAVGDRVRAGEVGSMKDIIAAQWEADRVFSI